MKPTSTSIGKEEYKCTECEYTYYIDIPMLEIVEGDVDGDGKVNVSDVLYTIHAVLNGDDIENADFNNDGVVSLVDVIHILKKVVKQ